MQIKLLSDIHLEVSQMTYEQVIGEGDWADTVLVLAGDVSCFKDYNKPHRSHPEQKANYIDFMTKAGRDFKAVVAIPGNHDFWGMNFDIDAAKAGRPYWVTHNLMLAYAEERCFQTQFMDPIAHLENVHLLVGGAWVDIDDYRFVGATTWTNLKNGDPMVMIQVQRYMRDFERSQVWRDHSPHSYIADDWMVLHEYDRKAVSRALAFAAVDDRKVVLVQHHAPSWRSRDPTIGHDATNYAYMNNNEILNDLNSDVVVLLCHGHIHSRSDYVMDGSDHLRVVCNPFGYQNPSKGMYQDTGFEPDFLLRLP